MWTYDPRRYQTHVKRLLDESGRQLGFFCDCGTHEISYMAEEAAGEDRVAFVINLFVDVALLEGVRRYDREAVSWYESVVPLKISVRRHHAEVPVFPHVLLYGAMPWDETNLALVDACVEALVPAWIQQFDRHQGAGRGLRVVRELVADRGLNAFAYYRELETVVPRFIAALRKVAEGVGADA